MKGHKRTTGDLGEELAKRYLSKKGYKIIERNYRCVLGEVDIIAMKDDILVFVEVKTRKSTDYAPEDSVTAKKRSKLLTIAKYYQLKLKRDLDIRFDVLGITLADKPEFLHIEGAF